MTTPTMTTLTFVDKNLRFPKILRNDKIIKFMFNMPFPDKVPKDRETTRIYIPVDNVGPNAKGLLEAVDEFLPNHNSNYRPIIWSGDKWSSITLVVFNSSNVIIRDADGVKVEPVEGDYFASMRGMQVDVTCSIQLSSTHDQPTNKVLSFKITGPSEEEESEEEEESDDDVIKD